MSLALQSESLHHWRAQIIAPGVVTNFRLVYRVASNDEWICPKSGTNTLVGTFMLSPDTERTDQREKWYAYALVESLKVYVIASQDKQG